MAPLDDTIPETHFDGFNIHRTSSSLETPNPRQVTRRRSGKISVQLLNNTPS
ncbi:uncharacterized protein M421DRAFT_417579 [Didymella exigua CBS 183.55]|uniref:Uncharacterized protein n=1 Tax=Didymella exigua CBS 183.55 TaxID=1150837 RepID=A0A6A5RXT8_9PLEO|nr:uncharacterized protein M421DRAFT_417579 [Didymella exigua CBS 183.55]KAF1931838.1 hypothetical protein M421DRAFT_417579 [Didymella exigua CBS 183.55]